ncbi:MAG: DUF2203 family protein [Planctomycetota bacterium]
MKQKRYDRRSARELLPLLEAIGREIRERTEAAERLEARLARLGASPSADPVERREIVAEIAAHRLGLRLARHELDRLGCTVVGTEPLTIRIPGRVGEARRSFVWQTGDPVLK